jgi:hypothetical protein
VVGDSCQQGAVRGDGDIDEGFVPDRSQSADRPGSGGVGQVPQVDRAAAFRREQHPVGYQDEPFRRRYPLQSVGVERDVRQASDLADSGLAGAIARAARCTRRPLHGQRRTAAGGSRAWPSPASAARGTGGCRRARRRPPGGRVPRSLRPARSGCGRGWCGSGRGRRAAAGALGCGAGGPSPRPRRAGSSGGGSGRRGGRQEQDAVAAVAESGVDLLEGVT